MFEPESLQMDEIWESSDLLGNVAGSISIVVSNTMKREAGTRTARTFVHISEML